MSFNILLYLKSWLNYELEIIEIILFIFSRILNNLSIHHNFRCEYYFIWPRTSWVDISLLRITITSRCLVQTNQTWAAPKIWVGQLSEKCLRQVWKSLKKAIKTRFFCQNFAEAPSLARVWVGTLRLTIDLIRTFIYSFKVIEFLFNRDQTIPIVAYTRKLKWWWIKHFSHYHLNSKVSYYKISRLNEFITCEVATFSQVFKSHAYFPHAYICWFLI